MRSHLELGQEYPISRGDDDRVDWEQQGEIMAYWVQEFLGQYFDFEDAIVDAVLASEDYWPQDGEGPFWDETRSYEMRRIQRHRYLSRWHSTLTELKHSKRFFSPAARDLFNELFVDLEKLKVPGKKNAPVVRSLPRGKTLYRSRSCNSNALLKDT